MIWSLARFAYVDVCFGLRRMALSMFWSTCALSTFAQFGVDGTNQLYFAASANGARAVSYTHLTLPTIYSV